jgi:hypothetical protein
MARTDLETAQSALTASRDSYQQKIRQSGSDPAGFVAACKKQGYIDQTS